MVTYQQLSLWWCHNELWLFESILSQHAVAGYEILHQLVDGVSVSPYNPFVYRVS